MIDKIIDKNSMLLFLASLEQNNSKERMDQNRDWYMCAKQRWIDEVQAMMTRLQKHRPDLFAHIDPKKCISRITNNRMYNQNLPIYKTYFTFGVMNEVGFSPLHISVGPNNSFVGCGFHNPDKDMLQKIRMYIATHGKQLTEIMENPAFSKTFGGLATFMEPLKTAPKGFDKQHPYIHFLVHKCFCVSHSLTASQIIADDFVDTIEEKFLLGQQFMNFFESIQ